MYSGAPLYLNMNKPLGSIQIHLYDSIYLAALSEFETCCSPRKARAVPTLPSVKVVHTLCYTDVKMDAIFSEKEVSNEKL